MSLPPDLDSRLEAAEVVLDSSRSRLHRLAVTAFLDGLPAEQRNAIQTRAAAGQVRA
ncbi:MAG: hypothetical protein ABJE95_32555 [Byssovorax sp.]